MNNKPLNVAILGATGLVGKELFSLLFQKSFPLQQLFLLGASSVGSVLMDPSLKKHIVLPVEGFSWIGVDLLFSCVDDAVAQRWIPEALKQQVIVIDNSSFYRLQDSVPLVIPEINGSQLSSKTTLVSNPNCTIIILLMGIFPILQKWSIARCFATTYQAMSGGGGGLLQQLLDQTQHFLQNPQTPIVDSSAFNLYPHDSSLLQSGYCAEEDKMIHESKKILQNLSFPLSPFCVRVPVLRAHSIHVVFTVKGRISLLEIIDLYKTSPIPGVLYYEQEVPPRWATPNLVSGKDDVFVGKFRKIIYEENTFEMWIVGDQLRKGAALNALQIAQKLL